MYSESQPTVTFQKCEVCDKALNPHGKIFKTHTLLCPTCYQKMDMLPDLVADYLTRFLIGNVV
jgi:hypothetical protein